MKPNDDGSQVLKTGRAESARGRTLPMLSLRMTQLAATLLSIKVWTEQKQKAILLFLVEVFGLGRTGF